MNKLVKGDVQVGATRNVVLVYSRVSSGALAEYVKPDDACLMLRDDAGSLIAAHVNVEHTADGGLQLAYAVVADYVSVLSVSVPLCGVAIGSTMIVWSGYDAINGTNHVAS